jgi:pyruvate/2-oxoglutarate dehydrogenase complex dihydrolipoamide dehydrogenase (E3) component
MALRSIAAAAAAAAAQQQQQEEEEEGFSSGLLDARQYIKETVYTVRARENPTAINERNDNSLNVYLVSSCRFVSSHKMEIVEKPSSPWTKNNNDNAAAAAAAKLRLHAKNFVMATGAAPVVPPYVARCGY